MGTLSMILSIAVLPVLMAVQAVSPKYQAADPSSYIVYMPQSAVPGPGPRDQYSDIYPKRAPSLVMDKRKFTSGGWTKRIPEDPDNGVWHTMQKSSLFRTGTRRRCSTPGRGPWQTMS